MPNGIVAELGVDEGDFSQKILDTAKPELLYLIDTWGTSRYGETKAKKVNERFKNQIENGSLKILRGLSTEKLAEFDDASLDWVYIDTDHSYETTLQELRLAEKKVGPDGFICGHDFVDCNFRDTLK